jgi:hypothetical protein
MPSLPPRQFVTQPCRYYRRKLNLRNLGRLKRYEVRIRFLETEHLVSNGQTDKRYLFVRNSCKDVDSKLDYLRRRDQMDSVAWVRKRTIPTERPPLVGEVSAKFADRGCCVVSVTDPDGIFSAF